MVRPVSSEPPDLSHLHESARAGALLSAELRLRRVHADRWIGYPHALEALERLERLAAWPRKQRMPNLLIIGPTNNGKSMLVEKFRRTHRPREDSEGLAPTKPVVVMQMPSDPSVIRFYTALLAAADVPEGRIRNSQPRVAELERHAALRLSEIGARMLVIDELHNLLAGTAPRRREFLNVLRYLGNRLRIPVVGVGTGEAYLAIRSDDQLENRFQPFLLPRWHPDACARSLLASFAAAFPLRRPSPIATPAMADYGWIDDYQPLSTRSIHTRLTLAAERASIPDPAPGEPEPATTSPPKGPRSRTPTLEEVLDLLDQVADDADAVNHRIQALLAGDTPAPTHDGTNPTRWLD